MRHFFVKPWDSVPTVWIDTETTGVKPGVDRAIQVALARFERGVMIGVVKRYVDPGIPIPIEATEVHGIRDNDVRGHPTIDQIFDTPEIREIIKDAMPGGYNCTFDRCFVAPQAFEDFHWPWFDCLTFVRAIDRYARGQGRHKLDNACIRHGISLPKAHDAAADAIACGELFYRIVPKAFELNNSMTPKGTTVGHLLKWQRITEANEWFRFHEWLSRQPDREPAPKQQTLLPPEKPMPPDEELF